jgi:hypothetical protein
VDGQVVSSQAVSGPGAYSVDHTFTTSGSHDIKATVVDQGLYDASDATSKTVAYIPVNEFALVGGSRRR